MSELIRVIAGSLMGHILITCLKLASLTLLVSLLLVSLLLVSRHKLLRAGARIPVAHYWSQGHGSLVNTGAMDSGNVGIKTSAALWTLRLLASMSGV